MATSQGCGEEPVREHVKCFANLKNCHHVLLLLYDTNKVKNSSSGPRKLSSPVFSFYRPENQGQGKLIWPDQTDVKHERQDLKPSPLHSRVSVLFCLPHLSKSFC